MALTQTQRVVLQKARILATGQYPVHLDDETCTYLLSVIVNDLGRAHLFPELLPVPQPVLGPDSLDTLRINGKPFVELLERLLAQTPDALLYFYCLAELLKRRIKYQRILETQPIPTIDQVGPRALLQYGGLSPKALAGFLLWRKWMFDIDNRAGQEAGYLFEPIIANAIGGVPYSASRSPIRRQGTGTGRQVDCLLEDVRKAYEFKLRITIAASGQGRWAEELEFPVDCEASGYTPVLVVLDPTPNPKLEVIIQAFLKADGEVYVGNTAWEHLETMAGEVMARFLEKYVREPIEALLQEVPEIPGELPDLLLHMKSTEFTAELTGETLHIKRSPQAVDSVESLPDDVDDQAASP